MDEEATDEDLEAEAEMEPEEDEDIMIPAEEDGDEMKKAINTRNQLQLWDSMMAIRMQLQPVCYV